MESLLFKRMGYLVVVLFMHERHDPLSLSLYLSSRREMERGGPLCL